MSYLLLSIVFGVVQIGIWQAFPRWFRNIMFSVPLLAVIANAIGSLVIVMIAGRSAMIGACNLTGSVIFAIYVFAMIGDKDEKKIQF